MDSQECKGKKALRPRNDKKKQSAPKINMNLSKKEEKPHQQCLAG
jgi:hypothetical protein